MYLTTLSYCFFESGICDHCDSGRKLLVALLVAVWKITGVALYTKLRIRHLQCDFKNECGISILFTGTAIIHLHLTDMNFLLWNYDSYLSQLFPPFCHLWNEQIYPVVVLYHKTPFVKEHSNSHGLRSFPMEPLFQFALEVAGLHGLLEVEMVGAEWLIPYIQNAPCNGSIPVRKDIMTSK